MKKIILGLIILLSIGFSIFMYNKNDYVHSEAVFVATDSLTNLGFKIDGKIEKMVKEAGDNVKKGELLSSLETKTLQIKLNEINYKIKSLNYNLSELSIQKNKLKDELDIKSKLANNSILEANHSISNFKFQILANQSKLDKLKFDKERFYKLYKLNKISLYEYKNVKSQYDYLLNIIYSQQKNLEILKIKLNSAKENLKLIKNSYEELSILDEKIESLYNNLLSLKENRKEILVSLSDSNLISPFDGVIAKKFVNQSTVIEKGTFIYSIVNPKDIYIKVLLSEKKLAGIEIGDKAVVKLDAFNEEFNGEVFKIMPVSASTFSLVPRDIASGEFTKLDQRFIVKIKVKYNPKMRIGMGGEVKIYKDKK